MRIDIKTQDHAVIVELEGRIDGQTAPRVQARISPLIEPDQTIIMDLTNVAYLSSAGLRLLATTQRRIAENNGRLMLAGISERIRDTMSITGFLSVFSAHETVEEALAQLR
jgi:anti-sigma B factor antagonist